MIVLSSRSKLVAQIIVAGLMVTPLFIFSMLFAKGDLFSFGKSFFIDILNITVFSFVVIWWLAIFINLKLNLKTSKCH